MVVVLTLILDILKLKIKKFTLPGTGGQCLMAPPEYTTTMPYISGMIFIVPSPNEMKAAINKKDERKGISEKGKK